MTNRLTSEICVIGGGQGAQTIAAAAASSGISAILVLPDGMKQDRRLPLAALIAAAGHANTMRRGEVFGMEPVEPQIDFRTINRHLGRAVATLAPNASIERFTALGVRVIQGAARFVDRRTLISGDVEIRARHFVIATGARPDMPALPGIEDVEALTVDTIFALRRLPGRLVVLRGGATELELAQAFRRLGSEVTVIEAASALAGEDPELTTILLDGLRAEGIEIMEGSAVERVERRGKTGVRVQCKGPGTESVIVDGTHLLVAPVRRPDVESLDLDQAGVRHAAGGIVVSELLRTTNRRIHAIGQATDGARSADVEEYHAGLVVQSLVFGRPARGQPHLVPRFVQTDPQLAVVGMTEAQAREAHGRIAILRWPYAENACAQAERRTTGLVKLVIDRKERLLGAAVVGANAGEMIAVWALAVSKGYGLADMANHIPASPTMGEIGKRAVISYSAGTARRPLTRRLPGFLRLLG